MHWGNPLDVGELDRIVIALMQELEFLQTQGIVIATSNLPENLDRALWRRFDLILEFPRPSRDELKRYAKLVANKFGLKQMVRVLNSLPTVSTYADAEKLVEAEARHIALREIEHR
jgi:SpoVK/Ycf46/Vps4 family AAA+-type ATPase